MMNKSVHWMLGGVLGLAGLAVGVSSLLGTQGKSQLAFITQSWSVRDAGKAQSTKDALKAQLSEDANKNNNSSNRTIDYSPGLIAGGINRNPSNQDKLYGYDDNGNLRVWYLTRNGQSKEYTYNKGAWDEKNLGSYNNSDSISAIGGNHILTKACIGKNATRADKNGSYSVIECDYDNKSQSFKLSNYPTILDIEVKDSGVVSAVLKNVDGNKFLCQDITKLSECRRAPNDLDRILVSNDDSIDSTNDNQFYKHFGHTINITRDNKVNSTLYPSIHEPATSVGLGNKLTLAEKNNNETKFVLWYNTNGNLYIYPKVTEGGGTPVKRYGCNQNNACVLDYDNGIYYNDPTCNNECKPTKQAPICGNGIVEEGEQCDDGDTINGDGCDSLCQKEPAPDPRYGCNQDNACVPDPNGQYTDPNCNNACKSVEPSCADALIITKIGKNLYEFECKYSYANPPEYTSKLTSVMGLFGSWNTPTGKFKILSVKGVKYTFECNITDFLGSGVKKKCTQELVGD